MSSKFARGLAWGAIAGQLVYTLSWIVAGSVQPHYSHVRQWMSELSARFAEHPWIFASGLAVLGLSIVALAVALRMTLPRTPAAVVLVALLGFAGAAMVVEAVAPLDCSFATEACRDRFDAGTLSASTSVHLWASLLATIALLLTPFVLARALWRRSAGLLVPHPVAAAALAIGVVGVALAALGFAGGNGDAAGLVQRVGVLGLHVWAILLAAGVLHEHASVPVTAPAPLPPRRFFTGAWDGEGEVQLRFLPLWRLRLVLERIPDWVSEDVCVVRDRVSLSSGARGERRLLWAFTADGAAAAAALDPPYAATMVSFTDDGYVIAPYDVAIPMGPLSLTVRCRDEHRVAADGSLIADIEARVLGVVVARATLRARERAAAAV